MHVQGEIVKIQCCHVPWLSVLIIQTFTQAQDSASWYEPQAKSMYKEKWSKYIFEIFTDYLDDSKTFIQAQASASWYETQAQSMYKEK